MDSQRNPKADTKPDLDALEHRLSRTRSGAPLAARWRSYLGTRWSDWAKRAFDVFASGMALLCFLPFGLVIAALIKLDGGPVFYKQQRVGLRGQLIWFPKFRTMVVNSDQLRAAVVQNNDHGGESLTFKSANDPRITSIGRFLRRTSLDEIPQLWLVFAGGMSLVGPRPAMPEEVAKYTVAQRRRLEVRPGLTCIWQISGRSQIPFAQQVELDLEYIRTRTFWGDIVIIFKTVPAVLFGRGAM
jgi:lipopolysaccharide/colanic/teichoic acid biosynthesis glycosyltransferase